MTDASWETLSNQAIAAAGVVYFLALLAHLVEWSSLRKVPVGSAAKVSVAAGGVAAPPQPPAATEVRRADDEGRVAMFGRLGVLLTVIAVAVHFVALVARGAAADPNRVPWGNMYEFTITGTFMVALGYVVLVRRFAWRWLAPIVLTVVVSLLMVAVIWLYDPVAPLTEALFSPWLVIHVVSAILATAAFTLGGMLSVLYLLKERRPDTTTGYLARVPAPRRPRPDGLPAARVRVPGVDVRGADHRADLGPPGVVVVLELGPQGGLGVHHLGRLRGVPARAHDGGLEGSQRRHPGAGRDRHPVVQLHRDQLLLHDQPALVRRRRRSWAPPEAGQESGSS